MKTLYETLLIKMNLQLFFLNAIKTKRMVLNYFVMTNISALNYMIIKKKQHM